MEFKEKWENNTPKDSNGYQNIVDELGNNVATCYGGFDRTIPISKLIASAPEMFEMLKRCECWISSCNEESFIIKDIKQLLTKITK